jgi:hypothetical protein
MLTGGFLPKVGAHACIKFISTSSNVARNFCPLVEASTTSSLAFGGKAMKKKFCFEGHNISDAGQNLLIRQLARGAQ